MEIMSTSRYCDLDQPDTSSSIHLSRVNQVLGAEAVPELEDIVNLYFARQVCNITNADHVRA